MVAAVKDISAQTRLGIVVALPAEARPLLRLYADLIEVPCGEAAVLLDVTGIGAASARAGARRLVAAGATALLSWGTAAGLAPGLRPGALVLPRIVIDGDRRFHADPAWHRRLLARLGQSTDPVVGPLASSGELLKGPDEKQIVYERTGACCADMESGAVAGVAGAAAIPFLSLRAVVDPHSGAVPGCVTRAIAADGRIQFVRLVLNAAMRPAEWVHLVRLARWFDAAGRTLTQAARIAGPQLLEFDSL